MKAPTMILDRCCSREGGVPHSGCQLSFTRLDASCATACAYWNHHVSLSSDSLLFLLSLLLFSLLLLLLLLLFRSHHAAFPTSSNSCRYGLTESCDSTPMPTITFPHTYSFAHGINNKDGKSSLYRFSSLCGVSLCIN